MNIETISKHEHMHFGLHIILYPILKILIIVLRKKKKKTHSKTDTFLSRILNKVKVHFFFFVTI